MRINEVKCVHSIFEVYLTLFYFISGGFRTHGLSSYSHLSLSFFICFLRLSELSNPTQAKYPLDLTGPAAFSQSAA